MTNRTTRGFSERIKDVFLEGGFLQSEELDSFKTSRIFAISITTQQKIMSRYGSMPPTKLIALMDAINMESSSREFILHLAGNKRPSKCQRIETSQKIGTGKNGPSEKDNRKAAMRPERPLPGIRSGRSAFM